MAADAGLIPFDKDVVAIAGTGKGADTALRIRTTNAARLFDLKIREVITKPCFVLILMMICWRRFFSCYL